MEVLLQGPDQHAELMLIQYHTEPISNSDLHLISQSPWAGPES